MRRPKRQINLADYIERLRALQRQSKAPAREDSQRRRRPPIKGAEKDQIRDTTGGRHLIKIS